MKVPRVNPPSDQALADRDRRAALGPPTTTGLICGDPLPGQSMLDRVR
jgi:hypothetical protein